MRVEQKAFAAKLRATRAILDMSQGQLADEIGLTQRSIHRIERGDVQPKVRTILTIEKFWSQRGISFEGLSDGGFRLVVDSTVLDRLDDAQSDVRSSPN